MRASWCILAASSLLGCSSTTAGGPSSPARGGGGAQSGGAGLWDEVAAPGRPSRVTVLRAAGVSEEEAARFASTSASALDDCVQSNAGKVSVRLVRRRGALELDLLHSSSLDPRELRCALDALVRTGSIAPLVPGEPRSEGFTSLVGVAW